MTRIAAALFLCMAGALPAQAASVINLDGESRTIAITQGGTRNEIRIGAGEAVQVCQTGGCFITFPDGTYEPLTGMETIEISGGKGRIR